MSSLRFSATLAAAAAFTGAARADFQALVVPTFADSSAAQFAYWGGNPGLPFTGFSSAVGGLNPPNDPASDLAATLTQLNPGAVLTTTGNIYGASNTLAFEVEADLPHAARRVVFQLRTLGSPISIPTAQLTLRDGLTTLDAPAPIARQLLVIPGGIVVEEWALEWDLGGLPIEATDLTLTFQSSAANCSFDDARMDVLHDGPLGTNDCSGALNSTGRAATISARGDDVAAHNALRLRASELPSNVFGLFLASRVTAVIAHPGGSQGNLCLGGAIGRYVTGVRLSDAAGNYELGLDLTAMPLPTGSVAAQVGETWHFQAWYRDTNPGATSNFTDRTSLTLR